MCDMGLRKALINYSEDVLAGKIIACQKHKWACARFLNDLMRAGNEDFPFVFDEQKALDFFEWARLFKHSKGVLAGQKIELHEIQAFIFGNIYGWAHKDTGHRRFKKGYWQVGRKNAKSQSLALVATYEAMAYGQQEAEVYTAATKSDQSKIIWKMARSMLNNCPELKGKYKIAYGEIVHLKSSSVIRPLSKEDRKTGDGLDPQCGIIDEYHAHETTEIYDILDSGMISRPSPLLMIITTAGFDLAKPCYTVEYKYVSDILDPDNSIEDDEYFVMINELDKDDDFTDERVWPKANPIVCSYDKGIENLRGKLRAALNAPEKMRNFLTKNMNKWVQQRESGYMRMDKWAACKVGGKEELERIREELRGKECFCGVDLTAKIDLASVAFEFSHGGKYIIFSHSFMPEASLAEKMQKDKVRYDLWAQQGWLTLTEGDVVDQNFIKAYIKKRAEEEDWIVKEIDYDPYNATQFATDMMADGFTVVEIRQGIKTLGEPTKNFRDQVYAGNVIHEGGPVLTWAVGNAVTRQDHNDNIMLDKAKSTQRIDPIAAVINAHTRAMVVLKKSRYENEGEELAFL